MMPPIRLTEPSGAYRRRLVSVARGRSYTVRHRLVGPCRYSADRVRHRGAPPGRHAATGPVAPGWAHPRSSPEVAGSPRAAGAEAGGSRVATPRALDDPTTRPGAGRRAGPAVAS